MKGILINAVTFLMLFTSCNRKKKTFDEELVQIFKTKSINKDKIDWAVFEKKVHDDYLIARDSAIVTALTLNGNRHTYVARGREIIQGRYANIRPVDTCYLFGAIKLKLLKGVGYLKIGSHYLTSKNDVEDSQSNSDYINQILESIKNQDRVGIKGWIIDLRYNSGGDMWPMLVATSPFFSSGILGYFEKNDQRSIWHFDKNEILLDNSSQNKRLEVESVKYRILNSNPKIAVLINHRTKSAGEATALAFKSLKNVKFFGLKTHGFATSNEIIHLEGGDELILTTGYLSDVNGKTYPTGIYPDIPSCSVFELNNQLLKWFNP
ncbi:S41 family peptidase [Pedobacter sp. MC2016-05]|uniref:S41 family peptidase n=1 Tax=Pedobacter sp. MC2016-05 TaxID=2994474 RepID=UPI00224614E4|nr:S41 family peptidase [Pedobacter sp. MC2016-05]MCX2477293.1 S41 family peptidase [Pedobacter sp. MC2016-05]